MKPTPVLLAILTDLSIDHRCFKLATSLRDAGMHPIIYCDRPFKPVGSAWSGFDIRILSRISHLESFGRAFVIFHLRLLLTLLFTRAKVWIALDCPPLLTLAILGRLRGATVIYDSHEIFTQTPMVLSRPLRRRFWTFWHDSGIKLTNRVIAVSPKAISWLKLRFPAQNYFLLPNAPPLHAEIPVAKPRNRSYRLVFQGGLRIGSGLEETISGLKDTIALSDFTLDIFGDGLEKKKLEQLALASGISNRIIFHGQVPFESLRSKLPEYSLGLHLMQPICDSFALTLANKLFDYIHAGLPMLLSDNPAHRAFLAKHHVGLAVDSFSPAAIAKGLEQLAANWQYHHEACLKAREVWHWQAFAKDLPAFLADGTPNQEPSA